MNRQILQDRRLWVVGGILLVAIIVVPLFIQTTTLRITSVDPGNNILPTAQDSIVITFNKEIQQKDINNKIKLARNDPADVTSSGKTVTVHLLYTPKESEKVNVLITDLRSTDNKSITKELSFVTRYVDFENLSKAEQARQVNAPDNFGEDYPLSQKLPYKDDTFEIDFRYPNGQGAKMPIIITTTAINTSDPLASPDAPSSLAVLRQGRQAAIAWLKQNGFNTDKYQLYFTEPQIVQEFGGLYYDPKPSGDI